jgi:heme/copper-type cytochrome/quinol oxidase subunit 4
MVEVEPVFVGLVVLLYMNNSKHARRHQVKHLASVIIVGLLLFAVGLYV